MTRPTNEYIRQIADDAHSAATVAKDQSFRAMQYCAALEAKQKEMQKQIDTLIQRLAFVTFDNGK